MLRKSSIICAENRSMNCFKPIDRTVISALVVIMLAGCNPASRFGENGTGMGENGSDTGSESHSRHPGRVLLTLEGIASYYAHDFHGKKTSSGETYNMNAFTAAHRTLPFGTKIRVTNLENHKTVIVKVNDRGPFKEGRIIDLSLGAAKKIDLVLSGTARVRLEVLEWGTGQ
jgi:rare lipoprotein A